MYQDSSCSSSSRRGSAATATTTAAAATTTAAAATTGNEADNFEALTIITTTTTVTTTADIAKVGVGESTDDDDDDDDVYTSADAEIDIECLTAQGSQLPTSHSNSSNSNSNSSSSSCGNAALFCSARQQQQPQTQQQQLQLQHTQRAAAALNADVRLLRKIGYIASRVRCLAKYYNDFRLVNPYSAQRQRRQLQEILLKHSIFDPGRERERALLLAAAAAAVGAATAATAAAAIVSRSQSCSSNSFEPLEEQQLQLDPELEADIEREELAIATVTTTATTTTATATATVTATAATAAATLRRKSSASSTGSGPVTATATASASAGASTSASASLLTAATPIALLEELLIQFYEDQDQCSSKLTVIRRRLACSDNLNTLNNNNYNNNSNSNSNSGNMCSGSGSGSSQQQQTRAYLQPSLDGDNPSRRRRASDCSAAALANQLHCITLKNNNCTAVAAASAAGKLPFHRGSCGAAGEHLLAANSIANRATIILSKSCSNVDGDVSLAANVANNKLRASATDIESNSNALNGGRIDAMQQAIADAASNNGNNEYSILQLNNTIIQCHFNDDDFRALVKDLKRKVEYTERMNWLCLSNRPLGPPHRKSSLPKHQEVKRRFLQICDTNFSDEVKAALRLPAFDSYEWGDADVIHLMQTMFLELGFVEKFSIPVDTLREWLYEVYKHYNEVPFHNFRHCFCVAQMMYAITRQANLLNRLGDLECLILLVSCICHDLDHPGYNNIYQINARTELALRYNDISPLENHHCSIAFRLLEHPECNIFKNFSRDTFNTIREGIIRCILATDMARHNEILTQFIEITPIFDYNNRAHINLLCMILIKVADISNEARPMDVAEPWLDRLLQEFFAQSAAEKSEGLPVTPFMDPDKVSKPGSQVRFIGLVLLPLFEALGELVPELTELIIIPVRIALEYYRRLNDAQTKTRKSVADSNASATSDSNSGNMDSNAAMASTPGHNTADKLLMDNNKGGSNAGSGAGAGGGGGGGAAGAGGGGGGSGSGSGGGGGSSSPQMPRSGSAISVKSRRSIPSQKSASRTSVDEPGGMAAELHDLPEGSESGDSETATEVDVAEKTSKFKVDTEGCSNRSKSSHSTSRKSSREKRPSMIGELCSSGGGQRIRNSYGNIHGYHTNRCHFGSNRAVSLDQYSTNNRRLSDGLPQVISDSNVFYGRLNRGSLEATTAAAAASAATHGGDLNMNTSSSSSGQAAAAVAAPQTVHSQMLASLRESDKLPVTTTTTATTAAAAAATVAAAATSNGNISPTLTQTLASNGSARSSSAATATVVTVQQQQQQQPSSSSSSWKSRLRQFSDYFSFSFDKGNKRFGSTRSSPCPVRSGGGGNNNATGSSSNNAGESNAESKATQSTGIYCNISNSPTPGAQMTAAGQAPGGIGRHRAYSLDVPCSRHAATRHSSGDSSSRKSSRHDEHNNSNNTLHSSSGGMGMAMGMGIGELSGIRIRIGSAEEGGSGASSAATAAGAMKLPPSISCEMGLASGSSSEAVPKI
ncbi:high affinity cGMP-specific 3',5'-cyclic phosphodiesterase 9A [Drosophila hydei]|uniref:Phosphodiesterase n=1 Tax=Drosophila hydei TaxID=7224 RepID=A0A6J2STG2_DROHY|nr:high affinity cGMP-specific 3',5'-cyclic phosphodiesterase 9A [Drosophila hydei]